MKSRILGLLALGLIGGSASAATTVFTDRNAFNAAAGGGLSFQSFETSQGVSATYTYPEFTVSETGGINAITHTSINPGFGTIPVTDGRAAIWFDDNGASIGTFQFGAPINAFGIDVTTRLDGLMTVLGDVSTTFSLSANTPGFFGVIMSSGSFSTVSFSFASNQLVGFDALSFGTTGTTVPEPGTLALLGLGLAGLGLSRRRKAV